MFGETEQDEYTDVNVDAGNVVTNVRVVVLSKWEVVTRVEVSVGDETQIVSGMARSSSANH